MPDPVKATILGRDITIVGAPAGAIKYQSPADSVPPYGMMFVCPCGCGERSYLAFDNNEQPHPRWKFSGSRDKPTLSPSVHAIGFPCKWHGWLRVGQWESV